MRTTRETRMERASSQESLMAVCTGMRSTRMYALERQHGLSQRQAFPEAPQCHLDRAESNACRVQQDSCRPCRSNPWQCTSDCDPRWLRVACGSDSRGSAAHMLTSNSSPLRANNGRAGLPKIERCSMLQPASRARHVCTLSRALSSVCIRSAATRGSSQPALAAPRPPHDSRMGIVRSAGR